MEGREAMKILIIGAGKIGSAIVRNVCHESHEVTVIDNDPEVIERIVNQYDVTIMDSIPQKIIDGILKQP